MEGLRREAELPLRVVENTRRGYALGMHVLISLQLARWKKDSAWEAGGVNVVDESCVGGIEEA